MPADEPALVPRMTPTGVRLAVVANSHQPYWFITAAGAGSAGIALATIEAMLHGSNPSTPFWTTSPLLISYALVAVAVVVFFCGVTGQRFPLADGTWRQRKRRRDVEFVQSIGKILSGPGSLTPPRSELREALHTAGPVAGELREALDSAVGTYQRVVASTTVPAEGGSRMRPSEVQMSQLRDVTHNLHQRYPEIAFHVAQAEEFDAQMTITSTVEPLVGRYIHEPSSASEPEDRLTLQSAVDEAVSQWRVITGRTPSTSGPHLEPMPDGRTKITCTLTVGD